MPAMQPYNFCWIIQGVLAGSSLPSQASHLQFLVNQGVKHLVSLTKLKPSMHHCTGKSFYSNCLYQFMVLLY